MKTVVKQDPALEVPTEVIAASIEAIAEGLRKIRAGRLNEKALVLLIQHAAPLVSGRRITASEVKAVIGGIESLESTYLKKSTPITSSQAVAAATTKALHRAMTRNI